MTREERADDYTEHNISKYTNEYANIYNAYLKGADEETNELSIKLANAVLIIKNLLHLWEDVMTEDTVKSMIKEAKQFIKEADNAE